MALVRVPVFLPIGRLPGQASGHSFSPPKLSKDFVSKALGILADLCRKLMGHGNHNALVTARPPCSLLRCALEIFSSDFFSSGSFCPGRAPVPPSALAESSSTKYLILSCAPFHIPVSTSSPCRYHVQSCPPSIPSILSSSSISAVVCDMIVLPA